MKKKTREKGRKSQRNREIYKYNDSMLEIIIMSVKNMLITVGGTSAASLKNLNVQLKTKRNQEKKFPFHINKKGKLLPCIIFSVIFSRQAGIFHPINYLFPHITILCVSLLPELEMRQCFPKHSIPAIPKRDRDYARH